MDIANWISLAGLVILWLTTLIIFFVKIKIKIAELEIKIKNTDTNLEHHINWGENEQRKNITKFNGLYKDMKDNQNKVIDKIDTLILAFSDFRVYVEKTFSK